LSERSDNSKKRGMDKARGRNSFGRLTVLAIVVGGHVLLVMLFANSRPAEPRPSSSRSSEAPEALVLLNLEPQPEPARVSETPALEPMTASAAAILRPSAIASADPSAIPDPFVGSSGSAITELPSENPAIDWEREAQRTAASMAPSLIRKQLRECEEAKKHGKYPPGCKKPASEYEPHWEPEPRRAGFAPLPYVRIGKRCVVGLGFFGCTLGKLPEPDGSVFENAYDTNRPQSSVPEVEASVFPERPAPQAVPDP
jgi:hypothetical protein